MSWVQDTRQVAAFILPVRSLKAAGLSWSIEASTSMGLRHCWHDSASLLSFAMMDRVSYVHSWIRECVQAGAGHSVVANCSDDGGGSSIICTCAAVHGLPGRDGTGQGRAGQGRAGQGRAGGPSEVVGWGDAKKARLGRAAAVVFVC